jgi:hypothetical protein
MQAAAAELWRSAAPAVAFGHDSDHEFDVRVGAMARAVRAGRKIIGERKGAM